jgi:hypothetical protein
MRDKELDDLLKQAAGSKPDVDRALLDRISLSVGSNLRPARELPSPWILAAGLVLVCGMVALAGAIFFGLDGVKKMSAVEIGLIFPVLGIFTCFAAALCVAEAIPGSRRPVRPWLLGIAGCVGLAAVFATVFHDYGIARFVSEGVKCLAAGLVFAVPASLAIWLILRRGFFVNTAAGGFAKGTLSGLAGILMLELHCANFEAPHVMVWHIAVLPICGAVGMGVAWMIRWRIVSRGRA